MPLHYLVHSQVTTKVLYDTQYVTEHQYFTETAYYTKTEKGYYTETEVANKYYTETINEPYYVTKTAYHTEKYPEYSYVTQTKVCRTMKLHRARVAKLGCFLGGTFNYFKCSCGRYNFVIIYLDS